MKFIELKRHIQSNDFYAVYNLFGDDAFLIDLAENLFVKYVIENAELNKTVLSTENFDAKSLQNIMNTSTFLGGRKLVFLRVIDEQKTGDLANEISNYAKTTNPNAILIISSKNAIFDAKKQENFKKINKFFSEVDCSRLDISMTMAWINTTLQEKNGSMSTDAKNLLFAYTNGYLSRIATELDKLISFANGREIEKADVELLVNKELEYSIFELTENLGNGNREKTFEIFNEMMNDKKSAPSVFALIQNYFRRMFFASITNKNNAEIATDLGVKEYAIKKAKDASLLFSKVVLKQIINLCDELDFKIKTGQIDYKNAVNYILMFILSNNKKAKL